jgi:hypothetical protein
MGQPAVGRQCRSGCQVPKARPAAVDKLSDAVAAFFCDCRLVFPSSSQLNVTASNETKWNHME